VEEDNLSALGLGLNDGTFVPDEGRDRPARRHMGGGNHFFVDGHAKWYRYEDLVDTSRGDRNPVVLTDLAMELLTP